MQSVVQKVGTPFNTLADVQDSSDCLLPSALIRSCQVVPLAVGSSIALGGYAVSNAQPVMLEGEARRERVSTSQLFVPVLSSSSEGAGPGPVSSLTNACELTFSSFLPNPTW